MEKSCLSCSCPHCGSQKTSIHYQEEACIVLRCLGCHLVFTITSPLERKDPEYLYALDYFKSKDPAFGYENYLASKDDIQAVFEKRLKLLHRWIHTGKLLDIGCAYGFFLEVARKKGWEVEGIDVSEPPVSYAREVLRLPIRLGKVEEVELPFQSFDCITLWDLIEQVVNPDVVLSKAFAWLKPGGLLALTIRDIDSWMSKLCGSRWIHFRPKEKFMYFNPKTISALLVKHGFRVLHITFEGTGKKCSLEILLHKLSYYNRSFAELLLTFFRRFRLERHSVYLNFFDTRIVLATKP